MSSYLIHIGTKNSGRYKRGSGKRPHQHDGILKLMNDEHKELKEKYKKSIDEYNITKEEYEHNKVTANKLLSKQMKVNEIHNIYKKTYSYGKDIGYTLLATAVGGIQTAAAFNAIWLANKIQGYKSRHPERG